MKIILTNFKRIAIDKINLNTLSKRAVQKIEKLKDTNPERAVQCAIGDLLLKRELEQRQIKNAEVLENINGKPYLSTKDFHFNIAHQNTVVAFATLDGSVGIDIQALTDENTKLLSVVLNELELDNYNALPDSAQKTKYFYRCFTEKEAYVKFKGESLPYPPSSIKSYEGAKFVTKYLFLDNLVYCLTVCASDIKSIKFEVVNAYDLIK